MASPDAATLKRRSSQRSLTPDEVVRSTCPFCGVGCQVDLKVKDDTIYAVEARLGRKASAGWDYTHPSETWEEMRQLTPDFGGITYERLEREGGVHWPCPSEDHPGTPYLFEDEFPRGRGKFWAVEHGTESELPDDEYPFILSTGRVLYHWHGGTITRRSKLDDIWPEATIELSPGDAEKLGLETGDWVRVWSRRGEIKLRVMVTGRSPDGTVFMPFHFIETAANLLTNNKIDPRAKIPDFKVCAVNLEKTTPPKDREGADIPFDERGAIKDQAALVH